MQLNQTSTHIGHFHPVATLTCLGDRNLRFFVVCLRATGAYPETRNPLTLGRFDFFCFFACNFANPVLKVSSGIGKL